VVAKASTLIGGERDEARLKTFKDWINPKGIAQKKVRAEDAFHIASSTNHG